MKKNYVKPEIGFESFGVTENFASSVSACEIKANFSQGVCGAYSVFDPGRSLFVTDVEGCENVVRDGEYGACYYIMTEDNNVFGS